MMLKNDKQVLVGTCYATALRTLFFLCMLIGLLHVPPSEATEFYLSIDGARQQSHCDFLEIQERKAVCTENKMIITYDLNSVRDVTVVDNDQIQFIDRFTPDAIRKINLLNQGGGNYEATVEKIERSEIGYLVHALKSVESLADVRELGEKQYRKYGLNGVLHLFLPLIGALFVLISSFWFIIAAFRVHILWGLGCLVFPVVIIFFLIIHQKAAAKPFTLFVIGVLLVLSGVYLFDEKSGLLPVKEQSATVAPVSATKWKKERSRFRCRGKTYCSEMTSCAEAIFYLQNCPGVQLDGNGDGVPCERQWCR